MKRAYELMTIFDREVEESTIDGLLNTVDGQIAAEGGQVMSTDKWGLRKFAYPIDHKDDGYYVVNEITTEARDLSETDRFLRLADEVVRHKIVRLPDHEADRRGLFDRGAQGCRQVVGTRRARHRRRGGRRCGRRRFGARRAR